MIVLVGLDNTLCNSKWREPLIETEGWEEYHAKLVADEPNAVMKKMICCLKASGHEVVVVTARPEKWRWATNTWFMRKEIAVDEILMRDDSDFRPAPQVKLHLAVKLLPLNEVSLMIDDRDDVIAAFRGHGVCCLQFSR